MLVIPDVESNGHVFSDGVGTLSPSLLERAVSELPRARRTEPTCLQIRYQGMSIQGVLFLALPSSQDSQYSS